MAYRIHPTSSYTKSLQKLAKSGTFNLKLKLELSRVIDCLANAESLPIKYRDHQLHGVLNII
jgi:mRNA-degrading endonuclease YafQ of YafQ-DinJ toxin-antitoxin module